ncbi:MAG: adenylate kinase [Planctomycetota bacterium]|nr:adenylate kinase [Planctomycetota bacterium]
MLIVFIGPPGAVKWTHCRRLVELFDIPHLSTGEMLRAVMEQDTALSRYVASYINAGKLAPDHLVMRIVSQKIKSPDCAKGALFDGFPRTMVQAQMLDDLLTELKRPLDVVLELRVPDEVLITRLLKRAKIDGRADDNDSTIRERLRVFHEQTKPLVQYYGAQGKLRSVDGTESEVEVFEAIRKSLTVAT